VQHT
jgi:hypothetical protein